MNVRRSLAAMLLLGSILGPGGGAWAQSSGDEAPAQPAASPAAADPAPSSAADRKQQAQQALLEGRELNRKGFSESAIVQYRKAIELDPDLAQAYIELGKILMDTKNQAFAITIYQKLAQLQPDELQWKEILFDLHTAYEMPREAAIVGEEILKKKPNDVELMKRLAEVYKGYGLPDKYAETMLRIAAQTKDAKAYYQAGEAYLSADMKDEAVDAYRKAVALEPDNLEYQAALGKGLNSAGDPYAARDHYAALAKKFPDAAGLKDRQAETELAIGDRLLERRRYVAAREAYETAQELVGTSAGDQGLGASLAERVEKARRLNHPYLLNYVQTGKQAENNFTWLDTVVGIPLQDTDVTIQVLNEYRYSSADNIPGQSIDSVLGGFDYKVNEFANIYGAAGSNQVWRLGGWYQDDRFQGGLRVRRDLVAYTPGAIATRTRWTGVDGSASYQIVDWLGLGGDFAFNSYSDNIDEKVYNIGPFFTPINRPNDFVWGIGYNHGGVFNDRTADPLIRFGPTNFQVDSFGTNIEHWINEDFRYHLGYYYSTSNTGSDGNTYVAGFDAQLSEGSFAWLNFEYGNFLGGRIAPGIFSTAARNYIIQGGLHITF